MSFLGLWSAEERPAGAATSSSTAPGVQRRFNDTSVDVAKFMLQEIAEEWIMFASQIDSICEAAAKFCDFFNEDQSLVPALRENREHFVAHHINGDGSGCAECAEVASLARRLHLATIELQAFVAAMSTRDQFERRQEVTQGKIDVRRSRTFYARHSAMPLIEEAANFGALLFRHIGSVRRCLLIAPKSDEDVLQLFKDVCDHLCQLCNETEALFGDRDKRVANNDAGEDSKN